MGASVSTMNQRTRKHPVKNMKRRKPTKQLGKRMKHRGKSRRRTFRKRRRRTQRGGGRYGFAGGGIPTSSIGSTNLSIIV